MAQARHRHVRQLIAVAKRAEPPGDGVGIQFAQPTRPAVAPDGTQALKGEARQLEPPGPGVWDFPGANAPSRPWESEA